MGNQVMEQVAWFPNGHHYKVAISAHCHKLVPSWYDLRFCKDIKQHTKQNMCIWKAHFSQQAPFQEMGLKCQWQIHGFYFGNDIFIYMYNSVYVYIYTLLYTYISIYV